MGWRMGVKLVWSSSRQLSRVLVRALRGSRGVQFDCIPPLHVATCFPEGMEVVAAGNAVSRGAAVCRGWRLGSIARGRKGPAGKVTRGPVGCKGTGNVRQLP